MNDFVFVYGSLRRGQPNHSWLAAARFLGYHRTEPRFTMRDLGAFPAAVRSGEMAILGEVYAITPRVLQGLDELEGYPEFYTRLQLVTPWGAAWIYLLPLHAAQEAPIVPGGDWVDWVTQRRSCCPGVR